jgi:single-strand DNA-binding protein
VDDDENSAASGVFVDDATGETLQLDSGTGELTGAAA